MASTTTKTIAFHQLSFMASPGSGRATHCSGPAMPGRRPSGHLLGLVVRDPACLTPLRPTWSLAVLSESPNTVQYEDFPPPCQKPRGSTATQGSRITHH